MKSIRIFIFSLLVCSSFGGYAQRQKDGNKVINAANTIVNEYTTLSADAAAGATTISVASSNLNANGRFSAALAPGDLIMIIQMQGASSAGSSSIEFPAGSGDFYGFPNDNTWGQVSGYNNCGNYEFCEVNTVPSGTSITIDCGLQHSYTAVGRVQVIRVPRYNSLTINSPGVLTCPAWATGGIFTGGVVAVEVYGPTTIAAGASINANGLGFRGGSTAGDNVSGLGGGQVSRTNNSEGSEKGEGIMGYQADYNVIGGRYCRGAAGNAGGGGDAHNAGGGGGANSGSLVGWDGLGIPDNTGAGWSTAWDLEGGSFSTHTSPGGGRGGYSFSASNQNALTLAPKPFQGAGSNAWGGDYRENNGGWGGRPLDYSTGRLFLGGGGGAGDQDNNCAGAGGKGGGLIYVLSYNTISGAGTITANGANGSNTGSTFSSVGIDGAGGAGGGGTIVLNTSSAVTGITASANGGNGGNQVETPGTNEAEGPGGGGGGGYIALTSGGITMTANGGANGTTNSSALTEFTPNGATKGDVGFTGQPITKDTISALNVSICSGNTATLTATLTGTIPATITWYSASTGGVVLGTGSTYTTPVLATTTTYYVGFCPGSYRIPVVVTVTPGLSISVNSPSICSGQTANLTATGGTTYTWTSGATSTGTNTASASPTSTTTYTVTGTSGTCSGTATATVTVNSLPVVTVTSPTICAGQTASLTASGATSYTWSAGATSTGTNTADVTPPVGTSSYTVTGTASGCTNTAVSTVTVNALPSISVNSPTICNGQTANLTASGGSSYTWSAGATSTGTNTADASPTTTTTYTVTGTASGCSNTASATVTVTPLPTISVTSPTICAGQTASLSASGGTSYSWSAGATSTGTNTADASPTSTTTYTVTGTSSGCSNTAVSTVTVNPLPDATIASVTPVCSGASPFNLSAATSGGTWSGTGITNTSAGTFDPATSGTGSFIITYSISATCSNSDTIHILVIDNLDATISSIGAMCQSAAPVNLTAANSGGTWTGTGITNASSGTFDPSVAGPGTYTITYSISGSCGNSDTALVTVNANADASITAVSPVCVGASSFNFAAATAGGTWSGTGITNSALGTFDPATAGVGSFPISYTISGACGDADTISIVVNATADASITPVSSMCVGASAFNLVAATSGGTWSGTGITNTSAGTFDPATAGVGSYPIIYTITGTCGAADTTTVTVTALSDVTIAAQAPLCPGSGVVTLNAATSGGTWSGTGVTNATAGTFDPASLSPGSYIVTYTLAGTCGNTDTATIVVNAPADASIAAVSALCQTASPFNLSAASPGGSWSGTGITNAVNGTFDPSISGPGVFTVTYGISGACGDTATQTVTVNSIPSVTLSSDVASGCEPLCVNFTESGSASCATLSVNFGDGASSSSVNSAHCYTSPGSYDLTVTCTDNNGCVGSQTYNNMINVFDVPVASFSVSPGGILPANSTVNFTDNSTGSPVSWGWSLGDGTTSTNQNPSNTYTNEGTYCIDLMVTNINGCADTSSDCITIANDATISVPNVFTPNGDGQNDEFFVTSTAVKTLSVVIYDRWGLKMAEIASVNGFWDGRTSSGNKAPDGVYYYILKATGTNDKITQQEGFIQLIHDK